MKKHKKKLGAALVALLVFGLASCGSMWQDEQAQKAGDVGKKQQSTISESFDKQGKSQPIPSYDYSEVRQVLLDVQDIQATGAASTSAFYLEGVGLIGWCPSRGVPVSDGWQLTPDRQWADLPGDKTKEWKEIDQGETTGVYLTGTSSGTYTLCLDDNGKPFLKYWEGYVDNTVAVVEGYPEDKRLTVDELTYQFKGDNPTKKTGN